MYCKKRRLSILVTLILGAASASAENIDPNEDGSQYAYGENVGWVNFEPARRERNVGATVSDHNVTGFIWAENIGWINLDPNDSDPNSGVKNDTTGRLSGLAWGENVGWINFDPQVPGDANHYGVTIDHEGNFDGWAWAENIGWIHLRSTSPVAYKVQTSWITGCVVDYYDLGLLCDYWLDSGSGLLADLNDSNDVDFADYSVVADLWLQLCPAGWPLAAP